MDSIYRKLCPLLLGIPLLAALLWPVAATALPVRSVILLNMTTGQILFEKNADAPIPPASLTKIMNMLLVWENVQQKRVSLSGRVTVNAPEARTSGSSMHLQHGEKVTLRQLLLGMAVVSGNDAARVVARHVSGSERRHVRHMNARARTLGMRRTTFKNVTGLPASGQTTCARDMLKLAKAYLQRYPPALPLHSARAMTHRGRIMANTNNLLGIPGVDGLKTGYTNASGYNLIFTARRKGVRLLGVVMGGNTAIQRDSTARRVLEAGFATPRSPRSVKLRLWKESAEAKAKTRALRKHTPAPNTKKPRPSPARRTPRRS